MSNQHKLKGLQVRLNKTNAEFDSLKQEQALIDNRIIQSIQTRKSIENQIKQIQESNKGVTMSEHAMLRYIERVLGFELSQITDKILTPEFNKAVRAMGDGKIPMPDGARAVVKNGVIVTIET